MCAGAGILHGRAEGSRVVEQKKDMRVLVVAVFCVNQVLAVQITKCFTVIRCDDEKGVFQDIQSFQAFKKAFDRHVRIIERSPVAGFEFLFTPVHFVQAAVLVWYSERMVRVNRIVIDIKRFVRVLDLFNPLECAIDNDFFIYAPGSGRHIPTFVFGNQVFVYINIVTQI